MQVDWVGVGVACKGSSASPAPMANVLPLRACANTSCLSALAAEARFQSKGTRIAVSGRTLLPGEVICSSAEPKWKQKLAAADEFSEKTRRATAQAQEDYKRRQAEAQVKHGLAQKDIASLNSLEFAPYLTQEGLIVNCTQADAKASVYAIFNETKSLEYVGVTRAVYPSMKLHFARMPEKCFYVKVAHLKRPSRALLESIREKWITENGFSAGNDNGERQNIWENPLDCKPLMTDEEKKTVEEAAPGPPRAMALKNVARRLEAELQENYRKRNCTEKFRFDPKLKDKGLLDLKNMDPKPKREPDSAVPTTNIKPPSISSA